MKFYDIDNDGNITYEEFLRGLREPLTARRLNMVKKAFALMDRNETGDVTVEDIERIYDVTQNQDFIDGRLTKEQILGAFLNSFEGVKGNRDGRISFNEWQDYYTDLSMSVTEDEYFVRMMEAVWGIVEDDSATVTKSEIEHLTKTMRHKLLDFSKHAVQDEYVLRAVFRDFDMNKNGVLTADELSAMLVKLQISVDRRYLNALLSKFDRNGDGVIDFEEFQEFLIKDPYH